MPDIVLKNILGQDVVYQGIDTVKLKCTEGNEQVFSHGVAVEGIEIPVDFSQGDMPISAGDGYLVKNAVVKKPETLLPENILADVNIAGIIGTATGGSEPVLNMPETEITYSIGNVLGVTAPISITPVDMNYIIEGATYEVMFNGYPFPCTAWKYEGLAPDGTQVEIIAIGNTYLINGTMTNEPFIIGTINGEFTIVSMYETPSATIGVSLDMSKDTILENVPIALDFSAGNQTLTAEEGTAIKSAVIQKPETLIPENIAEGIDIAGVVGTLAGGGGDSTQSGAKVFSKVVTWAKSQSSTGATTLATAAELLEAGINFEELADAAYTSSSQYVIYIHLFKLNTSSATSTIAYSGFSTSPYEINSAGGRYYWMTVTPTSSTPTVTRVFTTSTSSIFTYAKTQSSMGIYIEGGNVGIYKTSVAKSAGNYLLVVSVIPTV
ncbi:MAG: hypothetical protein IKU47_03330 [Oscillospiraceae bacterium]|nr:hypothetical protein [Oscillospiraceae bacterium]